MIDSIWREQAIARGVKIGDTGAPEEEVLFMQQGMWPTTDRQRALHARTLQVSADLAQTQLALFAQPMDQPAVRRPDAVLQRAAAKRTEAEAARDLRPMGPPRP